MFLQVYLPVRDKLSFSFLWWPNGDLTKNPETYEWNVHPFGAKSSPFCAIYALRRTASDNANVYPGKVVDAVSNDFCVEDYLSSFKTEREARCTALHLRSLLHRGGFDLVKWSSNQRESLLGPPEECRTNSTVKFDTTACYQRTLGLQWDLNSDISRFEIGPPVDIYSRRTVLWYISSVHDPLGFLAPFLLPGRLILQDLCWSNYA